MSFEKCDWRCPAILLERKEDRPPLVWNSLTHLEQAAFEAHKHPRPRNLSDFGCWVRKLLFTKKGACPTCGRP